MNVHIKTNENRAREGSNAKEKNRVNPYSIK